VKIARRETSGVVVLTLDGKLHHGLGDVQLREAVDAELGSGQKKIVLDLAAVKSMDSSGLGELVRTKLTATRRDAAVKLANLDLRVYELLTVAQLVPLFDIYDSEAAAVSSFG
jgi:anti-sigma B factor antagonist